MGYLKSVTSVLRSYSDLVTVNLMSSSFSFNSVIIGIERFEDFYFERAEWLIVFNLIWMTWRKSPVSALLASLRNI